MSILDIDVPGDVCGPATGFNVPANFDGVDVNVTVTNPTGSSFLTIFQAQGGIGLAQLTARPTSDVNWVPGEIISNGDIVTSVASFPFASLDVQLVGECRCGRGRLRLLRLDIFGGNCSGPPVPRQAVTCAKRPAARPTPGSGHTAGVRAEGEAALGRRSRADSVVTDACGRKD